MSRRSTTRPSGPLPGKTSPRPNSAACRPCSRIGGDGATYDIGFGALSRLLSTKTPIKVIVVNTGVYSNTGGQASTSSLIGQDSDLARYGAAHAGKTDNRKELGLIAAFHPAVMVVQTATSIQGHFLKNVLSALSRTTSPAIIDVYTPCQGEQGIGDDVSSEHARLAVESRTSPVYVHNPDGGSVLKERFSLDGNPDVEQDWTTLVLTYKDADGNEQTKEVPLTPAHFAHQEGRFKKQFTGKPLADDVNNAVSIDEFIDLSEEERVGKIPFIWEVKKGKLIRFPVPAQIVRLVEERRRFLAHPAEPGRHRRRQARRGPSGRTRCPAEPLRRGRCRDRSAEGCCEQRRRVIGFQLKDNWAAGQPAALFIWCLVRSSDDYVELR